MLSPASTPRWSVAAQTFAVVAVLLTFVLLVTFFARTLPDPETVLLAVTGGH